VPTGWVYYFALRSKTVTIRAVPMQNLSIFKQAIGLVVCLLIVYTTASIGAIASATAGEFYQSLVRPDWAPPGWLFGPVWTLLYTMIGVATWLIWRKSGIIGATRAHLLNGAQLVANALWSWLFFQWNLGALAFIEILGLWILIALTIRHFWKINRIAGGLLIPYLLWVTFASLLAYTTWQLNPDILS
jgi:benzodiazapine receptor